MSKPQTPTRAVSETLRAIDEVLGQVAQQSTRLRFERLFANPYHEDVWAEHAEDVLSEDVRCGDDCPCDDLPGKFDLFTDPYWGPHIRYRGDRNHLSPADYGALTYQHSVLGRHQYTGDSCEPWHDEWSDYALEHMAPEAPLEVPATPSPVGTSNRAAEVPPREPEQPRPTCTAAPSAARSPRR